MMGLGTQMQVPPCSSLQIQKLEEGFVCVTLPAAPVVAQDSSDVAAAAHLFLGASDKPSDKSSAGTTLELDQNALVPFEWPASVCPEGSVFAISKVQRIDAKRGLGNGYMVTLHSTRPETQRQLALFNRARVMDHLKEWLLFAPQAESSMISLHGMRVNPDMALDGERVFSLTISHSSVIPDYGGATPYVAVSTGDPKLEIGLGDVSLLNYVVEEMGGDMEGVFAARIEDGWLEIGPRIETDG